MADPTKSTADLKPGSSAADAAALSGKSDFGIHEADRAERTYASENTKAADHGGALPHSNEHSSRRQSGAGARDSGPGSGSGGDVDTDVVGLGGVGLSANVDKPAPEAGSDKSYSDGSSRNAASGGPAQGENQTHVGEVGGRHEQINVVTPGDARTINTGADEVSHSDENDIDDSFRGEISSAEASGRDDAGR